MASNASSSERDSEIQAGQEVADRLCDEWPHVEWVPDARSEAWARGAVERLAERMRKQPALFRASRVGAERGAETLSARPFQGILEALQNADDLGAAELRVAIRETRSRRELILVHDGAPVRLTHVGAMVLPWVTTKADDPNASGRFGIGQKTLRSLGGPIEVHCSPFHFRMGAEGPEVCAPVEPVAGLYHPERCETLVLVPLLPDVDVDGLARFVEELGTEALVFLGSVRRLSLVDAQTGFFLADHRLTEEEHAEVALRIREVEHTAKRVELWDAASGERYTRYLVEAPLLAGEQRHHKATGETATLGLALAESGQGGGFYDRVPLPIAAGFPFSLNAQFDPDTARSALLHNTWNEERLKDLGHLVGGVALDCFARDPQRAWQAIPLVSEVAGEGGEWLADLLREHVVGIAHHRLVEDLKIEAGGQPRSLSEMVFEEGALNALVTSEDQEMLAPGSFAVVPEYRDGEGRWREVMVEFELSTQITVREALALFDRDDEELGKREPRWYVEMAAAAVGARHVSVLLSTRSVLLADGRRVRPPDKTDPSTLVCQSDPSSLAAKLDLALPLHSVYLDDDAAAQQVIGEFERADRLLEECNSADDALQVLAREPAGEHVHVLHVDDDQLLALRDAFERLDDEEQRHLGPLIGRNIELRGFSFDDNERRVPDWVSPSDAYLPASIDRETASFPRAAAKTPGLTWLASSYARLLKRAGGRREIGAQRFLSRLGAATSPRLTHPPNEQQVWSRDTRPASHISEVDRPEIQLLETRAAGYVTHLLKDRWSPDLDAVINDIQSDRNKQRRRGRGLALLSLLARAWERSYADYQHAEAVSAYNGYWQEPRPVVATWLARAATERWLPSASGAVRAPVDLALRTEANVLAHGRRKGQFLARIDDHLLRSPALAALRIRLGPTATSIVKRLSELRDEPPAREAEAEARTGYKLLALACGRGGGRRPIGDMSVTELRRAFAGGADERGLLLVDGQWYSPEEVLVGPRIFGRYRPFVPASPALAPLWRALKLREPSAQDCVAVLQELAKNSPAVEDRAIVLETFRALAGKLDRLTPQQQRRLRGLALWTGHSWVRERAVYALEDEQLAAAVAEQAPVWQPGFSAFTELGALLDALGITLLTAADFQPVGLDSRDVVKGENLRPRFVLAVDHLRTELARGDQGLHDSITVSWNALSAARVIVTEGLELAAELADGKRVVVPADAYVLSEPLSVIVRSSDHAGTAEGGGAAIASLFSGDRQKLAWAWASMWHRADAGIAAERIILSTGAENLEDEETERLIRLKGQAATRARRKPKSPGRSGVGATESSQSVAIRPLRDPSQLQPDEGTLVNRGERRGGVTFPARTKGGGRQAREPSAAGARSEPAFKSSAGRNMLPPTSERERVAFDAVQRALRLDPPQIRDLRARRGMGADAMDDLRQLYEIKMESSPEFPNEVTLTRAEVKAAQEDRDFFLAVVSGLAEGDGQLRVRFIFDPLSCLSVRIKGEATLTGVREVEALEYRFSKREDA